MLQYKCGKYKYSMIGNIKLVIEIWIWFSHSEYQFVMVLLAVASLIFVILNVSSYDERVFMRFEDNWWIVYVNFCILIWVWSKYVRGKKTRVRCFEFDIYFNGEVVWTQDDVWESNGVYHLSSLVLQQCKVKNNFLQGSWLIKKILTLM